MEGAPPHGIEGKVPIAPSRFLDSRTGQTPLLTRVRPCPLPKTNLLPSSLLSLYSGSRFWDRRPPHLNWTGSETEARIADKTWSESLLTWNSLPEEHGSQILVSSRFPGFTLFSRHPNSVSGHPQVRSLPSSEPCIPGACSPAAARINTNPNPNTRICGRGRGQPGAMIAGPEARAVCSHHPRAKTQGCGSAPAPAFRGGVLASARPSSHSGLLSEIKPNQLT